ncbi:MAG TPA: type III PLP-dependent enzyme [Kineosporiaceae bacterium]
MSREYEVQGLGVGELAEEFGTPLYIYDGDLLRDRLLELRHQLHPGLTILYSLKANPNVSVCALLGAHGAGAEVSSLAELVTAELAGVPAGDTVFLGPGKSVEELSACLERGLYAVICESFQELALLDRLAAEQRVQVSVALRVNPSFEVKGAGLTMGGKPRQFGIDEAQLLAERDLPKRFRNLRLMGVQAYLGTRILDEKLIAENTRRILDLAVVISSTCGFDLEMVDIGGGAGVAYFDGERDLDLTALASAMNGHLAAFARDHPTTRMVMELGRYLTAPAGMYVVRVRYTKTSYGERFAITDGGTNHHMAAVGIGSFVKRNFPMALLNRIDEPPSQTWHIAGPLCTPNDTLGKKVRLPPVEPGDLIGVLRSGAYGPSASPGLFLSHGFPAEVLVRDGTAHLIRRRDRPADLLDKQYPAPVTQPRIRSVSGRAG